MSSETPSEAKKPRNKSKDISFSTIYLGFLACFMAVYNTAVFKDWHSWDKLWSEAKIFDTRGTRGRDNYVLVTLTATALVPLMGLYRAAWVKLVFAPLASSWAGLPPATLKHVKFCDQGFLAVQYASATLLGLYVLHDKPWWVGCRADGARLID